MNDRGKYKAFFKFHKGQVKCYFFFFTAFSLGLVCFFTGLLTEAFIILWNRLDASLGDFLDAFAIGYKITKMAAGVNVQICQFQRQMDVLP
jgi:hypothetical protein